MALWIAASGCGGETGEVRTATARDSAGVRITENPDAALGTIALWSVGPAPAVDIGGAGDAASELHRVTSVARLANGRIIVANAGTHELRLFDADGKHARTIGRRGEGPGEFNELAWVGALSADSLVAWDAGLKRFSVFDTAGTVLRVATADHLPGLFPRVHGAFADGSMVVSSGIELDAPFASRGVWRDSAVFLRVGADGAILDTLGRFPGTEQFGAAPPGGRGTYLVETLPFGRRTVATVAGERLHVGTGDTYEFSGYDPSGTMRERTRKAFHPLPVTERDIGDYRRGLVTVGSSNSADQKALDEILSRAPYPKTMPSFAGLTADAEGNVWVQETRQPAEWKGSARWTVFNSSGGVAATVRTPPGLTVHQIGRDWILGTYRDEVHVEHVRLYRLNKSPSR
ncbi:MAG TPA: 6-bladed beta-propeller [Longimicrobium sp.]|nr:6-bladed beta-propeller [Longimicrobium sp.]